MKKGDKVLTYNSDTREYIFGEIAGDYEFKDDGLVGSLRTTRKVDWHGRVSRDDLSVSSKNTLGSTLTIFVAGEDVWDEIQALAKGEKPTASEPEQQGELQDILQDLAGRSHEFIKDRIRELTWEEMQDLAAGILQGMGYKTIVSAPGGDRGKDIIASPDGLGLEHPRIRVEVKHRPRQQMGAPEVRSFIGALRQNDKGLYISTGGFSKEAHYEAERATVPVTLIDMDTLAMLLVQNYEGMSNDARALVPLTRFYWPTA